MTIGEFRDRRENTTQRKWKLMDASTVCFVDTETTGLHPVIHEIWEVGLILPDGSAHAWQLPVNLANADDIALKIGKFRERRQEKLEDLWAFSKKFTWLTADLYLCGANVSFDAERLARLLRDHGECPGWDYHLLDVEVLILGYLNAFDQVTPPYRSTDLSRAIGVDPDAFDRHTALGDARWAKAQYEKIVHYGDQRKKR